MIAAAKSTIAQHSSVVVARSCTPLTVSHLGICLAGGQPHGTSSDDVSDIWTGATLLAVRDRDLYDIEFCDDGALQREVTSAELRSREIAMDLTEDLGGRAACFQVEPSITSCTCSPSASLSTRLHTETHTHKCAHSYTHTPAYPPTRPLARVHIHKHTRTEPPTHSPISPHTHSRKRPCSHSRRTQVRTLDCAHAHTCTCACPQVHTCTHATAQTYVCTCACSGAQTRTITLRDLHTRTHPETRAHPDAHPRTRICTPLRP